MRSTLTKPSTAFNVTAICRRRIIFCPFCYTSRILEQIDFMGRLKRRGVPSVNSPDSISGILRTLGSYVDREEGHLLRVANYELLGPETAYRVGFALADGSRVEEILSKQAVDEITNSFCQERN
jgi:hypothetical protein